MKQKRLLVVVAVCTAAIAVAGAGIAKAVSGSDENVTGPAAKRAAAAAVKAAGGGTAREVEYQDGDGGGVYEVEVRRTDGSQIEVHLNAHFEPIGTATDDDPGDESEGVND